MQTERCRRRRVLRYRVGTLVFSSLEGLGEPAPALDPELGVDACEVALDGLERHVELVRDLAVGAALGREPGDAELAGGQRFHARAPRASRAGAGRLELVARPGRQRSGAAAGGEVERLGEGVACGGAFAAAAQGRAERGKGVGALEQRGRAIERGHRLAQQPKARVASARQPGDAQRNPQRARRPEHTHVGQLGVGQLARAVALSEAQERERGARARVHVTGLAGLHSPGVVCEEGKAGLEVGERLRGTCLRKPQASTGRRNEHRSDAGGPARPREQVEQRLRLVELRRPRRRRRPGRWPRTRAQERSHPPAGRAARDALPHRPRAARRAAA